MFINLLFFAFLSITFTKNTVHNNQIIYFLKKVRRICKHDLTCLRFLRWTVLVPIVIYLSLLLVKYNRSIPLKSLKTVSYRNKENSMMDNLFVELEAATISKKDFFTSYKTIENSHKDDESIREVEEMENRENPRYLLEDIFHRADTDENRLLDIQELAKWIHLKITEHITRAMRENVGLFTAIDINPRNGTLNITI